MYSSVIIVSRCSMCKMFLKGFHDVLTEGGHKGFFRDVLTDRFDCVVVVDVCVLMTLLFHFNQ